MLKKIIDIKLLKILAVFYAVVELLDGACGAQTSLACADATLEGGVEEINATGLNIGTTYSVRVYDYYADAPSTPTFTICVITPPPPPPNDNMSPNNEGFEDGGVPPCWTLLDEDGDGANWFVYPAAPHTGDSSMASASWNGAPLTPENYLILPQVTPGMDEHLTYWVAAQDPDYAAENYSVVLSTTGTAAADFSVELFTEVLTTTTWEIREVDLSAYMGMDIYIAFKHFNVTDEFVFKIDDVQWPTETSPCTVGLNEFNNVSYNVNIFPNPSATDVNFQSEENILSLDITDISGRLIKSLNVNNTQFILDRDELNSGVYFVTMNFEAGSMTQKLILE